MPPHDPNKMKESKIDKYKDLAMSVAIKKLKVTKSTFIKGMWEMKRFGWQEHGKGKLIRIAHQRLRFEVNVSKVDSKGIHIGNPVVVWIDDKLLFHEARVKLCERFGRDQDYTLSFKYGKTWVRRETDMDYEMCILHAKDVAGNCEDKILRMEVRLEIKNRMPILPLRVKDEMEVRLEVKNQIPILPLRVKDE